MKKSSFAVMIAVISMILAACGSTGQSPSEPAAAVSAANTSEVSEDAPVSDSGSDGKTDTDTESEAVSSGENEMSYETEEMNIDHGNGSIYGRLYVPETTSSDSLVILSHGFGGTYRDAEDYAGNFVRNGITAFAYDFTGGSSWSESGGSTTEMSVLTEADDLNTVLDYFISSQDYSFGNIFLLGESQGGFVSTYVAGTRPDDVAGLIALYPAYVLQDDSRERNPDPENGPETSSIMGVPIGKIYDVDAQSFNIYDIMSQYPGKVLIIHGTADSIVPVSYSERAAETFPDAELVTIDGAGHGFYGNAEEQAAELALQFVKDNEERSGNNSMADLKTTTAETAEETEDAPMTMTIGDTPVQVEWQDNESVRALKELVKEGPLTIQMSMYGGFEQVGSIGTALPRDDVQTTTSAGDIVLYSGDKIVVFYGSNSWAYTRLGRITDKTEEELTALLGSGDVSVTISSGE